MSEIKTDKLTGVSTAKTVTVTVGASLTQSLEVGISKAWYGAANDSITESLNFSSSTDNGNGNYYRDMTNPASYQLDDGAIQLTAGGGTRFARYAATQTTTTRVHIQIHDTNGTNTDGGNSGTFHGVMA